MIQNEENRVGKRDDAAGQVAQENPELNTGSNRVVSLNLRVVLMLSECVGVVVLSTCERLPELGLDASHRSPLLSRRFGHMGGLPFHDQPRIHPTCDMAREQPARAPHFPPVTAVLGFFASLSLVFPRLVSQHRCQNTSKIPEEKWRPPLMEEDWVVLCQAMYQSIKEEEWIEMHEKLREVIRKIGVKGSGQWVAGLGKVASVEDIQRIFLLSQV